MIALPRMRSILFLVAMGLALGVACGGDEDAPLTPTVARPPSVTIRAITSSSGHAFEVDAGPETPRFVEAGCDPGKTVSVALSLLDFVTPALGPSFTLLPPGFCAGKPQCGTALVTVVAPGGESVSTRSASGAPSLRLADLPLTPGEYVFGVQLLDDTGQPVVAPDGHPEDSVSVEVRLPTACGAPDASIDASDGGDSGADAALEAGSDASDAAMEHAVTDAPTDTWSDVHDAAPDQG